MSLSSLLGPLVGGVLIGLSALLLLGFSGRIAGVSGIASGLFAAPRDDRGWRELFLVGLLLGGVLVGQVIPGALPATVPGPWPVVVLAGFLVGFGSRGANGCTSGHGVCGLGRRSRRSLAAVVTFMATGVLTAGVLRPLLLGGAS